MPFFVVFTECHLHQSYQTQGYTMAHGVGGGAGVGAGVGGGSGLQERVGRHIIFAIDNNVNRPHLIFAAPPKLYCFCCDSESENMQND